MAFNGVGISRARVKKIGIFSQKFLFKKEGPDHEQFFKKKLGMIQKVR